MPNVTTPMLTQAKQLTKEWPDIFQFYTTVAFLMNRDTGVREKFTCTHIGVLVMNGLGGADGGLRCHLYLGSS